MLPLMLPTCFRAVILWGAQRFFYHRTILVSQSNSKWFFTQSLRSVAETRATFPSRWSEVLFSSKKIPQRNCVCLYRQPGYAGVKVFKKEDSELRERQTFLSGQLYFSKTSSYISVAPSVTSIIAWLHTLPRPVRLNCKKTVKGVSEKQITAE